MVVTKRNLNVKKEEARWKRYYERNRAERLQYARDYHQRKRHGILTCRIKKVKVEPEFVQPPYEVKVLPYVEPSRNERIRNIRF